MLEETGVGILPANESPIALQHRRQCGSFRLVRRRVCLLLIGSLALALSRRPAISPAIAWALRNVGGAAAAQTSAVRALAAQQQLRAKGAIHLHNVVLEALARGKLVAPCAAARVVGNGQTHTICFVSEPDRERWLSTMARAAQRVPARFCADCAQLVDLALCQTTIAAANVRQLVPGEPLPQERFLVFAAGHVALYLTSASFGSRMALRLWHCASCRSARALVDRRARRATMMLRLRRRAPVSSSTGPIDSNW